MALEISNFPHIIYVERHSLEIVQMSSQCNTQLITALQQRRKQTKMTRFGVEKVAKIKILCWLNAAMMI
jgi:hypothetical protein